MSDYDITPEQILELLDSEEIDILALLDNPPSKD